MATADLSRLHSRNLDARAVNLYRATRTVDVLAAVEYWGWWLAELESDGADPATAEPSIALAGCHLNDAIEEIERRQRLRSRTGAPPWPDRWRSALPDARIVKDALDIPAYYVLLSPPMWPERRGKGWVVRCDLPSHPGQDA